MELAVTVMSLIGSAERSWAAGIAMERHDLGPLETGRRLVDVVDDHFA